MEDWNQGGNFINKPSRGWLHPDKKIADSGISYGVRYIGCLEVNTSMKSLDFDTRSLIAKECINKLCEVAGLKTPDKKRKVIAFHEMPKISFASGGDTDTMDFVSYVAKDHRYGRACFVLECGGGLAQDVITTIGQAFELRYKQFLKKTPSTRTEAEQHQASVANGNLVPSRDDPEYYNDLPGKVPPDVIANAAFLDNVSLKSTSEGSPTMKEPNSNFQHFQMPYTSTSAQKDFPESLIDLTTNTNYVSVYRRPRPEYVNTTAVISNERNCDTSVKQKQVSHDIFDMQPFAASLTSIQTESTNPLDTLIGGLSSSNSVTISNSVQAEKPVSKADAERAALLKEPWFHGAISRQESEALVVRDGDFLVRESQNTSGQYVLTGMQNSLRKHLLLVDPEGIIRTKDQVFESVSHLIKYHRDNCLPIISAESALLLRTPVYKVRSSASKPVHV
ncbi:unnamed protein product [Larinioides sclopetarius]|uniref:SHC-transforming protein 1 n=1 Tax=Larinioides sclopetarius TaxID=280406 RepID=A0AAV1Z1V6_9ARAC